ncbi:MAG: hypothetical protein EHM61_22380 [Acidobacteria bacterium]|nr:MAG: hypothetical protein EHM61_22380 [Acidobacteriota bacterium]
MKEQAAYRIIHLSDLHLTASDSDCRSEPKLFGPLVGMNAAFRQILRTREVAESDILLVTGDVTDRGDPAAWSVFQQAVTEAGVADRVLVVPGNHDVCCLGLARLPGRSFGYARQDLQKALEGLRLAAAASRIMPAGQARFGRFPWSVQPVEELVIYGLNSNNLGNLTVATNALGEVDYYQLERLSRLLWKHREVPVKILALHHSPNIPNPGTAAKRGLKRFSKLEVCGHQIPKHERRALRLLCLSHRVRLIVHGHLHRLEDRRVAGIRTIGAPASTEPHRLGKDVFCYRFFSYTLHRASRRLSVTLHEAGRFIHELHE